MRGFPIVRIRSTIISWCVLLVFLAPVGADAIPRAFSSDERPLFASEAAANWSSRIDAPGKASELLTIGAGSVCGGVQIAYRFQNGGTYIGIKRETQIEDNAVALAFSIRSASPVTGIVLLEGNDGQFHRASFQSPGEGDQRIRLPLDRAGFPKFWDGKNDGGIHFPIRRLTVGITPQGQSSGSVELYDFACVPRDVTGTEACVLQLEPSGHDNVFFPDEKKVLLVHIRNQEVVAVDAELQVSLLSDIGAKSTISEQLILQPYEMKSVPIELPIHSPSFSELTATVNVAGKKPSRAQTSVAVVRPPVLAEVPFEEAFFGTSFGNNPQTMRRIGARFIREIVHWKYTNPAAGQFTFEKHAEWGRRCREAGVGTIFTFAIWQRPDWLESPDPGILKNEDSLNKWKSWLDNGLRSLLVDPKTAAVEIGNEPDLEFSDSVLVKKEERIDLIAKLTRTGYDLTHTIHPNIPVLGAGCSGGGEASLKLVKSILSRLDHKIDFVSIHPYPAGAQLMKANGAWMWPDKYLAETVAPYENIVSEFTNGKKIWCTELGWAYPTSSTRIDATALEYAAVCAQTLVILKSMNHVGKVAWFIGTGLEPTRFGAATHAEAGYSYNFFKRSGFGKYEPTSAVSAFSTVSSLLEGAKPSGNPDLGSAVQCHMFDNPATDQCVAALWATKRPVILDQSKGSVPMTVLDLFGRQQDGKTLRLTRSPIFLVAKHEQLKKLEKLLRSAQAIPEEPVSVEQISSASSNGLLVDLVSYDSSMYTTTISVGNVTEKLDLKPGKNTFSVTLPEESFLGDSLSVPLSLATEKSPALSSTFSKKLLKARYALAESLSFGQELTSTEENLLSGKLVNRSDVLPMDPNVGWTGVADLSVRYGFAWNEEGLYMVAVVRDDNHIPVPGENSDFYNFDSLQIVIDPLCDSGDSLKAGDREIGLALDAGSEGRLFQTFPITTEKPNFRACVFRRGQETIYKLQMPWSVLGGKSLAGGNLLALNFIVNDNDGGGRHYWMGPGDGIANGKRPSIYPWLYLMPKR